MKTSGGTNVRVAARCRPFNESEKGRAATRVVKMSADKTVIHNPHPGTNTKEHNFSFDHSYFWDTKTEQIFYDLGAPLLKKALEGYNATLCAYGQKFMSSGSDQKEGVDLNIQSEGAFLNKGIQSLNAVLSALADSKKKEGHIPYRDSKLTRILQDSFGGSAYTAMITTVSPADSDYEETLTSMQCGNRAKLVDNAVKKNEIENTKIIQDLRDEIARLREKLATSGRTGAANKDEVLQMEELIKDLQTAKRQTWEERERLSELDDEERRITLANKGILDWVMDSTKRDNKEVQEKLMALQKEKDQLTAEFKEKRKLVDELKDELQAKIVDYSKMAETGKSSEDENKSRVASIHELKEKLKSENDELKKIKHQLKEVQEKQKAEKEEAKSQTTFLKGNAELRYRIETERREKHEKENALTLADEVDRVKMEVEQEKAELQLKAAEGVQYSTDQSIKLEMELVELKAERTVMSLQIESVTEEKKRLKADLEEAYKRHKEELEIQQLQHFQTFRNYREVFEDQKAAIEQRYRTLLEEAIQDAVFLSTRNQELMHENQVLKQEMAELKDQVSLGGAD
ncbi:kinesin-like protein KIN-4A [Stylophora pistillata]|uniref:kinesin-like protein KIN-4A n=1 Tax=Stylophora pistillata TaxID=50429 RepID=UPI000C051E8A|nr:kinesin-like protein KIN-4A [Stylophora pistillata]